MHYIFQPKLLVSPRRPKYPIQVKMMFPPDIFLSWEGRWPNGTSRLCFKFLQNTSRTTGRGRYHRPNFRFQRKDGNTSPEAPSLYQLPEGQSVYANLLSATDPIGALLPQAGSVDAPKFHLFSQCFAIRLCGMGLWCAVYFVSFVSLPCVLTQQWWVTVDVERDNKNHAVIRIRSKVSFRNPDSSSKYQCIISHPSLINIHPRWAATDSGPGS